MHPNSLVSQTSIFPPLCCTLFHLNRTGLGLGSKAAQWGFFLPKDSSSPTNTAFLSCDLDGTFLFLGHLFKGLNKKLSRNSRGVEGSWNIYRQGWMSWPVCHEIRPLPCIPTWPRGAQAAPCQGWPGQRSVGTQTQTTSYPGYVGFGRIWPVLSCT